MLLQTKVTVLGNRNFKRKLFILSLSVLLFNNSQEPNFKNDCENRYCESEGMEGARNVTHHLILQTISSWFIVFILSEQVQLLVDLRCKLLLYLCFSFSLLQFNMMRCKLPFYLLLTLKLAKNECGRSFVTDLLIFNEYKGWYYLLFTVLKKMVWMSSSCQIKYK